MKREGLGFVVGFLCGVGVSYLAYRNKAKLKEKLDAIEKQINSLEIKEKLQDIISSLKNILEQSDKIEKDTQEEILREVEKRIKKLEEIIKR